MELALRPYMTAGVAVAGAGLIAVTPIGQPALDIQTRAVQLSATMDLGDVTGTLGNLFSGLTAGLDPTGGLPSLAGLNLGDLGGLLGIGIASQEYPITTYAGAFTDTITNLQTLGQQILADPAPILSQILTNQIGYANDLLTAGENAGSNLLTAVQDLPAVLSTAFGDLQSGDVFDAVTGIWQYLLQTPLSVVQPLVNGVFQVIQGVVGNLDNVVSPSLVFSDAVADPQALMGPLDIPQWFSDLVQAPLYGPNAAVTAVAGVTQDIFNAAESGNFATVLGDLFYAPSTVVGAFLNGYEPFAQARDIPDVAAKIGLNPALGLLTSGRTFADGGGTIANILATRDLIADDLGAAGRSADSLFSGLLDVQNGPLAALLSGASPLGLPDLSGVLGDLGTFLNPATALGDIVTMFDPSAATDIGGLLAADLAPNLGGLLLGLLPF